MRMKAQFRVKEEELLYSKIDFSKDSQHQISKMLHEELMKYVEVTERKDEYSPDTIYEGEIYVLSKSQFQHVIGLLKTLKGISPAIDGVVNQIADELINR